MTPGTRVIVPLGGYAGSTRRPWDHAPIPVTEHGGTVLGPYAYGDLGPAWVVLLDDGREVACRARDMREVTPD